MIQLFGFMGERLFATRMCSTRTAGSRFVSTASPHINRKGQIQPLPLTIMNFCQQETIDLHRSNKVVRFSDSVLRADVAWIARPPLGNDRDSGGKKRNWGSKSNQDSGTSPPRCPKRKASLDTILACAH